MFDKFDLTIFVILGFIVIIFLYLILGIIVPNQIRQIDNSNLEMGWVDCGSNIEYKIIIIDNKKYIVFGNKQSNSSLFVVETKESLGDIEIENLIEK